jgi:type I restriction enzyme R subunit
MSERTAVQDPMLRYAEAIGWDYVPPTEALRQRGGEAGIFFTDVLRERLLKLNPGIVDGPRADSIIRQLTLLRTDITGNRDALAWLRGEQSVFVPEEGRERNVRLVDFDDLTNNVYHVTDEWRQRNPRCANRADVVFLVNGIPVAVCETKSAGKADGLSIGVDQIRRYHRETPEMLIAPQLFEVTELRDFYYAATWSTSRKNLFNWKEDSSTAGREGLRPSAAPSASGPKHWRKPTMTVRLTPGKP